MSQVSAKPGRNGLKLSQDTLINAKMNNLDVAEEKALEKFRKITADLNQDDGTLIRFLRARNLDLKNAELQLRKAIKWREDFDIESLKDWDPPAAIKEDMRRHFTGLDEDGVPVFISKLGKFDVRPLLAQGLDILRFEVLSMEILLELAKRKNEVTQFVLILDLSGLTFGKAVHWGTLQLLTDCCKILEVCYPEIMKRCIFINCPTVFWYAYNFVKFILSAHTQSKISIFNSDETKWRPFLLETVPADCLTEEYGGTAIGISVVDGDLLSPKHNIC